MLAAIAREAGASPGGGNTASGIYSTVSGGQDQQATTDYSYAPYRSVALAGRRVQATFCGTSPCVGGMLAGFPALHCVTAFGSCPCCHEAEAQAFLARLRRLLEEMGG